MYNVPMSRKFSRRRFQSGFVDILFATAGTPIDKIKYRVFFQFCLKFYLFNMVLQVLSNFNEIDST